jgi:CDP-diacylglycerol--glycerol-3-phosphate 3-phosphatidyltransferase/cardiolipin synthase
MNLPNKLSVLRILLIPIILIFLLPIKIFGFEPTEWNLFISEFGRIFAAILFIIASLTDYADGVIARKYNMITNLGKFLDSLADKMLVISVLIALVDIGRISSIFVVIIVLREFMVTGLRLIASNKGVVMAAEMIGKIKTVTQMIAIIFILFEPLFIIILTKLFSGISATTLDSSVILIGNILFSICVIMTIISGLDYMIRNKEYLREKQ